MPLSSPLVLPIAAATLPLTTCAPLTATVHPRGETPKEFMPLRPSPNMLSIKATVHSRGGHRRPLKSSGRFVPRHLCAPWRPEGIGHPRGGHKTPRWSSCRSAPRHFCSPQLSFEGATGDPRGAQANAALASCAPLAATVRPGGLHRKIPKELVPLCSSPLVPPIEGTAHPRGGHRRRARSSCRFAPCRLCAPQRPQCILKGAKGHPKGARATLSLASSREPRETPEDLMPLCPSPLVRPPRGHNAS